MRNLAFLLSILALPVSAQDIPDYVGSETCIACHNEEAVRWQGSHHALAWTVPGPETVVADFDGTTFVGNGMTVRFSTDGSSYQASVTEADGSTRDYRIHSVVGIEPLQQYLIETEPGRLQSFDVVWDTGKGEWFHLYPDQRLPPDDGLHWTGPYKNWNARCAECHATGFEKNYDARSRTYASTQAEIGVGCESCHGPGSAHLGWTEGHPVAADLDRYGFTMDFTQGAEVAIQQCAGCHSRREAQGNGNPLPGTSYGESYTLSLLQQGLYHADGQILDEVYVYGSFLQSKMYARGVSCINCHNPHDAKLVAEGNAVCTQCHSPAGNPKFPSLPRAEYDTPDHTFHEAGSEGAQCKSCHMVERVYMGNDLRADHSFRVPRPDLSAETGAPDACTGCHADQTSEWAAGLLDEWFPDSTHRGPHFGQVLAAGRRDPSQALGALASLAEDGTQAGLVRATALWLAGAGADTATADRLAALLDDPDPLVRASALRVQQAVSPTEMVSRVIPKLSDPSRAVRTEAVRMTLGAPIARMPRNIEADFRRAMQDWQDGLSNRLDFPETHLVLAGIALTMRDANGAERAFREVVGMDPQRSDAWTMLVRIAEAVRGPAAARDVLDEARGYLPEDEGLRQYDAQLRQRE